MASAAEQLAANLNVEAFQKATELHKRLLFTMVALIIYRIGCYVPIPGINISRPDAVSPRDNVPVANDQQPITLVVQNATTNGARPLTYSFDIATDTGFDPAA